jgi:hypothetical protein
MYQKIIAVALLFVLAAAPGFTQAKTESKDSVIIARLDQLKASLTTKPTACVNCYADTTKKYGYLYNENGHFVYSARTFTFGQWVLVFLPVGMFLFIMLIVVRMLLKSDFSLADALSENYTIVVDVPNANRALGEPPSVPEQKTPRSVSRLIALLSGLVSLIIGTSATSYYFYVYLKTGAGPNLENLFDILLALGVGVVPYAFNRVAAAFKGDR